MSKKLVTQVLIFLLAFPAILFAGSTKSATKYPIVLSHGMAFESNVLGLVDYWGNIPGAMNNNGAHVYITNVSAMESKANKGAQWKNQILQIMAVTGASKVNVIGHSDGCLYTRYAISNLGMASKIASHTSVGGPHRGSVIADMIMKLGDAAGLTGLIGPALDLVFAFVYGGDPEDSVTNGYQETRPYMINVFNPNTPNMSGVYYQSYAGKITNLVGAGIMGILWAAMLPFEGDNDGLVSISSAKWGNFRGVIDGGFWSFLGGVNHLAEVGALGIPTPGYDAPTQFVNIAADLKNRGY
jgi:triacylglycerol lipase